MLRLELFVAMLLLVSSAPAPARLQGQRVTARPSTDGWEVTEQTNRPSLTLELSALTMVPGRIFQVRPVLLVRCQGYELELFVSTGLALESDDNLMTPVRVQWGAHSPEETRWSRSTDSTSAFAPEPRAFLRQLLSNPDLRLEIHPSGKSAQLIRFNARGLERHMPQVEAACSSERTSAAHDEVYAESAVDERPQIVSAPQLDYPPALREAGIQGRVSVQVVIDTLGRAEPASLKILARPNTAFDQSARDYVLRARFRSGRLKGRAVRVLVRLPLEYRIN